MASKLHILVAGRAKPAVERFSGLLEEHNRFRISTRHILNGHADPLWGLDYVPDLVVLLLSGPGYEDLVALGQEQASLRPPMIVIAEQGDAQSMRLAMHAGARDFLHGGVSQEDLIGSIERVVSQVTKSQPTRTGRLTAIVNAKGGSGATFIASNVAHIQAAVSQRSTALLSLDMQFNSLAHYFDMKLRHGLVQVLESADDLDTVALDAYMTPHESGLRVLGALPAKHFERHTEKPAQLGTLLKKMTAHYDDVVVDMPRRIDGYTVSVLEQATTVVLVVQQTLSHLQDATRMLQILRDFDVDENNVLVVLNRFEKSSAVGVAEIQKALQGTEVVTVPSDFKLVAESINLGVPMHRHAKGSSVTKALMALETRLGGASAKPAGGLLSRTFVGLLRKDSAWPQA